MEPRTWRRGVRVAPLFVMASGLILSTILSLGCLEVAAAKPSQGNSAPGVGKVVEITDLNFDAMMKQGPWMVVVSASWCPHCKQLEPTWTRLAEKLRGKVRVGKIDGPENKILAKRLHITGYPTIFHVDRQGKIRDYGDRQRDLDHLSQFAVSGYRQYEPLPWYYTPTSTYGQLIKAILEMPRDLQEVYSFLSIDLGEFSSLPPA